MWIRLTDCSKNRGMGGGGGIKGPWPRHLYHVTNALPPTKRDPLNRPQSSNDVPEHQALTKNEHPLKHSASAQPTQSGHQMLWLRCIEFLEPTLDKFLIGFM